MDVLDLFNCLLFGLIFCHGTENQCVIVPSVNQNYSLLRGLDIFRIRLDVMYLTDWEVGLGKATLDIVLCVLPESCFGLQENLGGRCGIDVVDGLKTFSLCMLSIYDISTWFESELSQYVHCCGNNDGLYQEETKLLSDILHLEIKYKTLYSRIKVHIVLSKFVVKNFKPGNYTW